MKQTSLLTQFKVQSIKKSAQPNKLTEEIKKTKDENDKSFQKQAIVLKDELINENNKLQPQALALQTKRSSNRRSRDSFQGIPPNIEKRTKVDNDGVDEETENIPINVTGLEKTGTPSSKLDSQQLKDESKPAPDHKQDRQNEEEIKLNNDKSFHSRKLLFTDPDLMDTKKETKIDSEKSETSQTNILADFKKPLLSKQTLDIIASIKNKKEAPPKEVKQDTQANQIPAIENSRISDQTQSIIDQVRQSPGRAKFSPSEYLSRKSPNSSPAKSQLVMVLSSPIKNSAGIVSPQKAFYVVSPSKINAILKSPSMTEKYGDLVKEGEKEYLLPYEYKRLMKIFEHLDSSINYHIARGTPTFFSNLAQAVENLLQMKVTQKQLAQIMFVMPEAYKISWQKNEKSQQDYSLYLDFPTDENELGSDAKKTLPNSKLEQRKTIFKNHLVEITKGHHKKFLETLEPYERNINYDIEKCWNSKFDVHNCPPIPEAKLPVKPHHEGAQSIHEFLKSNEIQNNRTKAAIEEIIRKIDEKPKVFPTVPGKEKKGIAGISEKLLEKIRQKEQILNQQEAERKKNLEKNYIQMKKDELKKVAEIMKIYYTQRGVSNMFYASVVDHISDNKHNIILGKSEVSSYIDILLEILPNWLSITTVNGNKILKMDKTVNMTLVLDTITSAVLPQK